MKRIDAHQHFWKFHPVKDVWISDEMAGLKRDFMPADLQSIYKKNNVEGCIAVQADQSLEETRFLLDLAADFSFIHGVVGWVDLRSEMLEKELDALSEEKKLKGLRHLVQAEKNPEFLIQPAFLSGLKELKKRGYSYDLLITSDQLTQAVGFAKHIDDQPVVIDHLAKPTIIKGEFDYFWASEMKKLSKYENFYCKLSGLVTEGDWKDWHMEDFEPYINHVLECFGSERLMYGSDWPVCTLAATYEQTIGLVDQSINKLSANEQEKIWYQNAKTFYRI